MIDTKLDAQTTTVFAIERVMVIVTWPATRRTTLTVRAWPTTTTPTALAFTTIWNARDITIETADAAAGDTLLPILLMSETDVDAAAPTVCRAFLNTATAPDDDAETALPVRRLIATAVEADAEISTMTAFVVLTTTVEAAAAAMRLLMPLPTETALPTPTVTSLSKVLLSDNNTLDEAETERALPVRLMIETVLADAVVIRTRKTLVAIARAAVATATVTLLATDFSVPTIVADDTARIDPIDLRSATAVELAALMMTNVALDARTWTAEEAPAEIALLARFTTVTAVKLDAATCLATDFATAVAEVDVTTIARSNVLGVSTWTADELAAEAVFPTFLIRATAVEPDAEICLPTDFTSAVADVEVTEIARRIVFAAATTADDADETAIFLPASRTSVTALLDETVRVAPTAFLGATALELATLTLCGVVIGTWKALF